MFIIPGTKREFVILRSAANKVPVRTVLWCTGTGWGRQVFPFKAWLVLANLIRNHRANLSPQRSCRMNCAVSWDILVCPGYSCSWAICPDVKIPGAWYPGGPSQVWQVKTEWLVQIEFQINNWYILKEKSAFYLKLKFSECLVFIAVLVLPW